MTLVPHTENLIDRKEVVHQLIQESRIGRDFYFLLTISTLIVTIGLITDSAAVVIGGMLIAPLLSPILALGLSIITANKESLIRSGFVIIKSVGIVLAISTVTAFLISVENLQVNKEIIQRIEPTLPFMYIALLSGLAATYAWARPQISAALPGIAVVVALLPPLATTGIGISVLSREMITGSFQLFIINLIGITVSSAVVFSLLGYHQMRWVEKKEIDKEKEDAAKHDNQVSGDIGEVFRKSPTETTDDTIELK